MKLLDHYEIGLKEKLAVIINHSDLVSKPLAKLFLDRDATVDDAGTRLHRRSRGTSPSSYLSFENSRFEKSFATGGYSG